MVADARQHVTDLVLRCVQEHDEHETLFHRPYRPGCHGTGEMVQQVTGF